MYYELEHGKTKRDAKGEWQLLKTSFEPKIETRFIAQSILAALKKGSNLLEH